MQNVLKYIIAQRPRGSLAKSPQSTPNKTPRKAQSAPPTPLKKPLVDKKLAHVVTTSSQLAKTLSPLKALVMGKPSTPQIFTKLKGNEPKKIVRSTESDRNNSDDKNDSLNLITSEESTTHVPAKNYEPESTPNKIVCKESHDTSKTNTEQHQHLLSTPSQINSKDDSKLIGPLVVKYKGLAPSTQSEHFTTEDSPIPTLDTQKVHPNIKTYSCTCSWCLSVL